MAHATKPDNQQIERTSEQKVFSFTGVFATACRLLASLGGLWVLASQVGDTLGPWRGGVTGLIIAAFGAVLWNEWNIHRRGT